MFSIEMLQAIEGDALWIEYGNPDSPYRILIDCGYKSTYRKIMHRLRRQPEVKFELLVMTHIDNDHIAGAVPLVADGDVTPDRIGQIWFNGREQIDDSLGAREAEYFTRNIERKAFPWNTQFGGGPIVMPETGPGDPILLKGDMRLTLLSPAHEQLKNLLEDWEEKLEKVLKGQDLKELADDAPKRLQPDVLGEPNINQLAEKPFTPDDEPTNGSSIAFLAEYRDPFDDNREKAALFTGDSFSPVLEKSLSRLLEKRRVDRLKLDAFKVSHHGSKKNTSSKLLDLVSCRHFLISTNGSRHKHPDQECIARIVTSQKRPIDLHFNYNSKINKMWRSKTLMRKHKFTAHYPHGDDEGHCIEI